MTVRSISRAASLLAGSAVVAAMGCFSERQETTGPEIGECRTVGEPCVVDIRDFEFHPAELHVARGVRVTWVNRDGVGHSSTSDDGTSWDSGLLSQDVSFEYTFDQAGQFGYHCVPHPGMTGLVVVE